MWAMVPRVSLAVPTFNGARHLAECLDSALAQTFGDFELLIVDDASSDATRDLAAAYAARDRRVRLENNPRRLGLVGNWNRAAALARGEWIKFLFQDDLIRPDCLRRMLAAAGPRDALIACRRDVAYEGVPAWERRLYERHLAEHSLVRRFPGSARIPARAFAALLLRFPAYNCVGEPTAWLLRAAALRRHGPFKEDFVNLCDWELCARLAVHHGLRYVDEPLAVFRVHPAGESARNRRRRRYRAEVIDDILLRHDLAYDPAFAPVRRLAAALKPPADLEASLAWALRVARRDAARFARHRSLPDAGAPAAWRWALARRPVFRELLGRRSPRTASGRPDPRRAAALGLLAEINRGRLAAAPGLWA